jgi:hypothetical protein
MTGGGGGSGVVGAPEDEASVGLGEAKAGEGRDSSTAGWGTGAGGAVSSESCVGDAQAENNAAKTNRKTKVVKRFLKGVIGGSVSCLLSCCTMEPANLTAEIYGNFIMGQAIGFIV